MAGIFVCHISFVDILSMKIAKSYDIGDDLEKHSFKSDNEEIQKAKGQCNCCAKNWSEKCGKIINI